MGKLPRVPAVFDKKEHWRKYPEEGGEPGDGDNYVSARDNLDSIKKQFEEERALGAMREVLEVDARREYGSNLLIAPIGAIEKADASFRVISTALVLQIAFATPHCHHLRLGLRGVNLIRLLLVS